MSIEIIFACKDCGKIDEGILKPEPNPMKWVEHKSQCECGGLIVPRVKE